MDLKDSVIKRLKYKSSSDVSSFIIVTFTSISKSSGITSLNNVQIELQNNRYDVILAHLSLGELIGYSWSGVRP